MSYVFIFLSNHIVMTTGTVNLNWEHSGHHWNSERVKPLTVLRKTRGFGVGRGRGGHLSNAAEFSEIYLKIKDLIGMCFGPSDLFIFGLVLLHLIEEGKWEDAGYSYIL